MRLLRPTLSTGSGFEGTRYLTKWLLLSTAIGIVAGLGAILFYLGIQLTTRLLLGRVAGYLPPDPVGEGSTGILLIARPWLLPVVTTVGGLLSGLIVFGLAPEAEGHGTDAAIEAIHHKGGRIRARIPPVKLIASAITIGSGGSGGREGPAAQISAGFGSLLGQWLRLEAQDRRIAVAAGMGAGIGAIFRAPLGGAVLAAEILYIHDLEVEAIIPALIAAIVGYTIYGSLFGFAPIFGPHTSLALGAPVQLLYYAVLGLLCGLMGIMYARSFYGLTDLFRRWSFPNWIKPALGGALVGLIGLVLPGALHMGYGWVQLVMGAGLLTVPLWVLIALPFAKIAATSLSIGSGGSGGVFGPGMVIGGMLGALFWRLAHGILPQMPAQPTAFVIVGMMALFGGIAHAPLAVMLMVAEMTGNLSLLAPAMVAVAVSTALTGDNTIYRNQLPHRADAPAHRLRFSFPLLSSLLVRDAMVPPGPVIRRGESLESANARLARDRPSVPVVGDDGKLVGIITSDVLHSLAPEERGQMTVDQVMLREVAALAPDQPLDAALERLTESRTGWAPVTAEGLLVGEVHVRDIIRTYKATLRRSVRRASALPARTALFEARLGAASPLAGRTLEASGLPVGTLVVAINRDGETIFPRAATRLEAGDEVLIVADPSVEVRLRKFLEGSTALD